MVKACYDLGARTSLEIGYCRSRFGSDLSDTLDRSSFVRDPSAYEAYGTIHALQPTLRLDFFASDRAILPYLRFGLVIAWGQFEVKHLSDARMLMPGQDEINLEADIRTAGGVTIGAGAGVKLNDRFSTVLNGQYVYVADTEIQYSSESSHFSYQGDNFGVTWLDLSAGIRFTF